MIQKLKLQLTFWISPSFKGNCRLEFVLTSSSNNCQWLHVHNGGHDLWIYKKFKSLPDQFSKIVKQSVNYFEKIMSILNDVHHVDILILNDHRLCQSHSKSLLYRANGSLNFWKTIFFSLLVFESIMYLFLLDRNVEQRLRLAKRIPKQCSDMDSHESGIFVSFPFQIE